ncbi:hypothetical protein Ndes2526B_g07053 [Nannochloris sp. 'desiccata']
MKLAYLLPIAALLCISPALIQAVSDNWGIDTLTNLPEGRSRGTVPVEAGDIQDTSPIEVPCQCSDADPREEFSQKVGTNCYNHRIYNNCNQEFMFDANAELAPEGFYAAFDAAISKLGPLAQNPGLLQEILKFHILPPEYKRNAVWTSPFMSLGPKMRTSYDGIEVLTAEKFDMPSGTTWQGGLSGFSINGPP